ncbi:MAG TPA: hypothetical protein VGI60_00025 [Chthoniobacterales bacterium]|jgi:hypothetical protein
MEPTWKHHEVFPIIAHIIERQYREHQRYITAREIAAQLLQDDATKSLIEHAQSQQSKDWSAERLAHNMVAWFSQRITVGDSPWSKSFERTKIDDRWAYKPASDTP